MARAHTLSTVLTLLGALLSASASASVTTSYAGTNCVQEVTLSPQIIYQNSRAIASSPSPSYFACAAAQQGGAVIAARASGRDLSADSSVTCHVEAMDEFDGASSFGASVSSGAEFTGNFTLDLPPPDTFFEAGSKVVHCTLPPAAGPDGSSVGSYAITEQ